MNINEAKMLFGSRMFSGANDTYDFNWGGSEPFNYYNSYGMPHLITSSPIDEHVHNFYKDKASIYIDDKLEHSKNQVDFITPYKMIVFGCNTGGEIGLLSKVKLYYLRFYDDNI